MNTDNPLYILLFFKINAIIEHYCDAVLRLPCIMDGGSPSLQKDALRITGLLLTGLNYHYSRYCGLASVKPMSVSSAIQRRVEQSSLMNSTKEFVTSITVLSNQHFSPFRNCVFTLPASYLTAVMSEGIYHV